MLPEINTSNLNNPDHFCSDFNLLFRTQKLFINKSMTYKSNI